MLSQKWKVFQITQPRGKVVYVLFNFVLYFFAFLLSFLLLGLFLIVADRTIGSTSIRRNRNRRPWIFHGSFFASFAGNLLGVLRTNKAPSFLLDLGISSSRVRHQNVPPFRFLLGRTLYYYFPWLFSKITLIKVTPRREQLVEGP